MNELLNEFREDYLNKINDETLNEELKLINKNLTNDYLEYVFLTEMAMINSIMNIIKQCTDENKSMGEMTFETITWLKNRFNALKDYYEDYVTTAVNYITNIQQEEETNDE